jgi:flagellar hook-associated protein 2
MSTINSLGSGIGGGLDVQSIVDNLMVAEQIPITRLQNRTQTYQTKISAYQTFNPKLLALKTAAEGILFNKEDVPLNMPSDFADRLGTSIFALRKATSSNEAVVTATAGKGIATGNFAITVSNLAKYSAYASNRFASDTAAATKTGTITIQRGTETAVPITITAENNTLQGIKNAINAENAGFTASILNDGSGTPYRLVVTANDSGSANNLTIDAAWDEGSEGSEVAFSETSHGEDAALQVNGVDIISSSNSVTNAIEGVTLNLKAGTGTATISTERDTDAIVAGLKEFVTKYNDIVNYIASQTRYDATKKTAGILAGDFVLRDVQTKLSSALSKSISADGNSLQVLSQVGIKLMNDGTLSLDDSKFQEKLSTNYNDTAHLLLADGLDSLGNTTSFIPKLQQQLGSLTDDLDGPVFHAKDSLQLNIDGINKQISLMQDRMDSRRALLVAQYTKANEALTQLTVLQTSITNQMNSLKSA